MVRGLSLARGLRPRRPGCAGRGRARRWGTVTGTRAVSETAEPCLVLSNDDGVESPGLLELAEQLRATTGLRTVVVAPEGNHSGAGMAISLNKEMKLTRREDLGPDTYSVAGTPADSMLSAVSSQVGLLHFLDLHPVLALSGVNKGPNLGQDVLYSGTVAAARMAAMAGVPAIASSLCCRGGDADFGPSVSAVVEVAGQVLRALPERASNWPRTPQPVPACPGRRASQQSVRLSPARGDAAEHNRLLLEAFEMGDLLLNVNIPPTWAAGGDFAPTQLGLTFYVDALRALKGTDPAAEPAGFVLPTTGEGGYHVEPIPGSDAVAVFGSNSVSVTTLQTWPEGHPYCLRETVIDAALEGRAGWPAWLGGAGSAS